MVLVDHDMNFVREWADTVCVLQNGKFVEHAAPEDLLDRPDSIFRSFWADYNRHGEDDGPDATNAPEPESAAP